MLQKKSLKKEQVKHYLVMNKQHQLVMSEHTPNNDDKIPRWFYNTVISMGIMVFVAFGLILFGMI